MKRLSKIVHKIFFLFIFLFSIESSGKTVSIGSLDSKVTVKVFSSLTCPACANFHSEIFYSLKKDFIDKGLVRFEHHPFPLDLAALNAEIILRCHVNSNKKFELLGKIYEKQNSWATGSDISKINESITKIGKEVDLEEEKIKNCFKDDKAQDKILNQRIEAQKNYKIQSTPTIFINEKKYTGKISYKDFKKALERYL